MILIQRANMATILPCCSTRTFRLCRVGQTFGRSALTYKIASTFGTSVYTPAVADLMRDFGISRTVALLGLTFYTLGIGFGPMATAPLSEFYGRRIIYLVSSPIFMLFTLGAGFSKSFYSLVICRFFAGFAGSPALAVGAGTNADLFPPRQRAVATSMFLAAPFAGPALG
jgi:MFS family permease